MKTLLRAFSKAWPILTAIAGSILAVSPGISQSKDEWQSQHFTTSDGVRLHYLEAGPHDTTESDESVIVFVPGWTMPAWIWEHQIRQFSRDHRVIAFDPRGQGDSEKPAFGYDHSRRALDIGELIAQLDTVPVVLVGWSLGVLEVVKYLDSHGTDAVRATVLVDWQMHYEDPAVFTGRYISLQTEREEWTRNFINAIFRGDHPDEYIDRVTEAALATPTNAASIMIGNIILQGDTDLRPFIDSLDIPALFIYGASDWAIAAAKEIREGWPQYQVEVIDNAGHTLFVDYPDVFNRVLSQFLESLPSATKQ